MKLKKFFKNVKKNQKKKKKIKFCVMVNQYESMDQYY